MTFKIFGQILDKATLWTVLDGQLPNFLDIGRTLDIFFWKLAPLLDTHHQSNPLTRALEGGADFALP